MPVGYGLCQGVWLWQLFVVGCPRVSRCQMNVVGSHMYDRGSWMWLVSPCLQVLVGCGLCPRVCLRQMIVVDAHVCGHGNWM